MGVRNDMLPVTIHDDTPNPEENVYQVSGRIKNIYRRANWMCLELKVKGWPKDAPRLMVEIGDCYQDGKPVHLRERMYHKLLHRSYQVGDLVTVTYGTKGPGQFGDSGSNTYALEITPTTYTTCGRIDRIIQNDDKMIMFRLYKMFDQGIRGEPPLVLWSHDERILDNIGRDNFVENAAVQVEYQVTKPDMDFSGSAVLAGIHLI